MRKTRGMAYILVLCAALCFLAQGVPAAEMGLGKTSMLLSGENAGSRETELGRTAAEAVRLAAGTEAAIVNGGDIYRDLAAGTVTEEKLAETLAGDRAISVAAVTPRQLYQILENGLSHLCLDLENGDRIDPEASDFGAFPQLAGLRCKYDASALPGERVLSVSLGERELSRTDDSGVVTLAATDWLLSGGWDSPVIAGREPAGFTLGEAFKRLLAASPDGVAAPESRMKVIGSGDGSIAEKVIPSRTIGVLILAFVLCFGLIRSGRKETGRDEFD